MITETCAIRGTSKAHLASMIHCRRLTASPVRIQLSLADLENLTAPTKP